MPPAIAIAPYQKAAAGQARRDGFGRLARAYRWLEYLSFGPWLALCRNARLRHPAASTARRALVLGDGDGRFLAHLLRWNPELRALSVDASPGMLARQRHRAAGNQAAARLTTRCQDIRGFQPFGRYDLVATHFFLDCLSTGEVEALARRIRPAMATEGPHRPVWIVSDFAVPAGVARWPAWLLIAALYRAFGLLTGLDTRALPDHAGALERAGFQLLSRRSWLAGLLISEVWSPCLSPETHFEPGRATAGRSWRSHRVWTSH